MSADGPRRDGTDRPAPVRRLAALGVSLWLVAAPPLESQATATPVRSGGSGVDRPPGSGSVTLIHIGDIHGHLVPRPDVHSAAPRTVGGLARMRTVIEDVRRRHGGRALLINVGDLIQGSAEALFTRGQAVIDALEPLRIDVSVPGNWDFVYGVDRFIELFVGSRDRRPIAGWSTVAANLYYATPDAGIRSPFVDLTGERVVPPFVVRDVGGVRVGIIGLTTTRGPRALGKETTRGFMFTSGDTELSSLIARLRNTEQVDVVVVASELELANNIRLAEQTAGIDVVLSADMHELTLEPIVTSTGTVIVEEGQDGAAVGELTLTVRRGRMAQWTWRSHGIDNSVRESPVVARRVAAVRRPFLRGPGLEATQQNPIAGVELGGPIDQVVGYTAVALHRSNPSDAEMPAVLEGSSHDFLADSFRAMTGSDLALIRGFRFGTHVRPGPITRGDLYHLLPIGGQVARVDSVPGAVILKQLESSVQGALEPDPRQWTGGWVMGVSGLTFDVDPYAAPGRRVRNVRVDGVPLDTSGAVRYSVAGLWFASEPEAVSNCSACLGDGAPVRRLTFGDRAAVDAVEVVVAYLASFRGRPVAPASRRVHLVRPLPPPSFGFAELQPLRGAVERARAGQIALPRRH